MSENATPFKVRPKIKRTVFDYNRGNFDEPGASIEAETCGTAESAMNVNHDWLKWKEQCHIAVCGIIPKKTIGNASNPAWTNGEIIHAIMKKT